ncbi:DNA polymerase III subunit epsilon [Govanella unica]|uniref:DNA polymerase III subunit epsilon n=1 Tax=Govanella unica TaxID=2975056 RepID=A0A9X3TV86_9PROT|nr:DNA polymerase III subunit epsilon [Govania unica]MDA5192374.1 DNA polymerase III subunit epsilon [Govania unica]
MREIVFDTETTGFDPASGDRVVEIGCVEIVNLIPTGRSFHKYVNPERDMPAEAFAVHGLSAEFLRGHPLFAEVVAEFLDFIGDDQLVAHNAEFDIKFLNFELKKLGFPPLAAVRVVDTLAIARRKFPGSPSSLDALCKRFGIDNSVRDKHGALLDSELLAEVYLELMGGRQVGLELGSAAAAKTVAKSAREFRAPRPHAASDTELAAHTAFVDKLKNAVWRQT